jgi:hypothetical protein
MTVMQYKEFGWKRWFVFGSVTAVKEGKRPCQKIRLSRYLKRVISKRDGCEYLKQVPSIDGSLERI